VVQISQKKFAIKPLQIKFNKQCLLNNNWICKTKHKLDLHSATIPTWD